MSNQSETYTTQWRLVSSEGEPRPRRRGALFPSPSARQVHPPSDPSPRVKGLPPIRATRLASTPRLSPHPRPKPKAHDVHLRAGGDRRGGPGRVRRHAGERPDRRFIGQARRRVRRAARGGQVRGRHGQDHGARRQALRGRFGQRSRGCRADPGGHRAAPPRRGRRRVPGDARRRGARQHRARRDARHVAVPAVQHAGGRRGALRDAHEDPRVRQAGEAGRARGSARPPRRGELHHVEPGRQGDARASARYLHDALRNPRRRGPQRRRRDARPGAQAEVPQHSPRARRWTPRARRWQRRRWCRSSRPRT